MNNDALLNLQQLIWAYAFREGRRLGLTKDGHYHPDSDRDLVCMYCMGGEL